MVSPILQVEEFRKTYGEVVAANGISFEVYEGEIFGLLGPNGAGKTTTLETLEGLRAPDAGRLVVAGVEPANEPSRLRDVIGVQLQSGSLPESITPAEAMRLICGYRRVQPRFDLLERLGLHTKLNDEYHSLSGGQQRRLILALATAHQPKVLFLDEPTAGLDVPARVELHNLMEELREQGATILLATHDMAEAEELADRVAILLRGRIAATGTPRELTAAGAGLTKVSVSSERSTLSHLKRPLPGVHHQLEDGSYSIFFTSDIGTTLSAMISCLERDSDALIDLRVERPSLEDRFLEITNLAAGTPR